MDPSDIRAIDKPEVYECSRCKKVRGKSKTHLVGIRATWGSSPVVEMVPVCDDCLARQNEK